VLANSRLGICSHGLNTKPETQQQPKKQGCCVEK
jgi:hypothetical protein